MASRKNRNEIEQTSEQLMQEIREILPSVEKYENHWLGRMNVHADLGQAIIPIAYLLLKQQQEIEQLRAELDAMKNR